MPKSKYETHVEPYLDKIEEWARKGATHKEIAKKLHVGESTMKAWIDKGNKGIEPYKALRDLFARAYVDVDAEVEAALFKTACGYTTKVLKHYKVKQNGEEILIAKYDEVHVPANTAAQQFWLANRRKDRWAFKPEAEAKEDEGGGVIMIPDVGKGEKTSDKAGKAAKNGQ